MSTRNQAPAPRAGQNHFPPPNAVPDYTTRYLPSLPLRPPRSAASSLYESSEGLCRQTPSRFHRRESRGSLYSSTSRKDSVISGADLTLTTEGGCASAHSSSRKGSSNTTSTSNSESTGSVNGNSSAVSSARRPSMSIVTDFNQARRSVSAESQEVILSLRPKRPNHKIVKSLDGGDGFDDVSPILSPPPMAKFSFQTCEVSPLTPEDGSIRDFGREENVAVARSGPGPGPQQRQQNELRHWAGAVGQASRRISSQWEDVPPAASRTSIALFVMPLGEIRRKSVSRAQRSKFRYSDPGSPSEKCISSKQSTTTGTATLAPPALHLNKSLDSTTSSSKAPRRHSDKTQPTPVKMAPPEADEYTTTSSSPYGIWNKGYGQQKSVVASTSFKVLFAVQETPSFSSSRSRAGSKAKPAALHLHDGKTADEHVQTPFPEVAAAAAAMTSSWDYDDDDEVEEQQEDSAAEHKKTSSNKSSDGSGAKGEAATKKKHRGVGKLVSRVKHTGGDVLSKLSFTSEESKREKRIEELKAKIHHTRVLH